KPPALPARSARAAPGRPRSARAGTSRPRPGAGPGRARATRRPSRPKPGGKRARSARIAYRWTGARKEPPRGGRRGRDGSRDYGPLSTWVKKPRILGVETAAAGGFALPSLGRRG